MAFCPRLLAGLASSILLVVSLYAQELDKKLIFDITGFLSINQEWPLRVGNRHSDLADPLHFLIFWAIYASARIRKPLSVRDEAHRFLPDRGPPSGEGFLCLVGLRFCLS